MRLAAGRIALGVTVLVFTMGHDHGCSSGSGTPTGAVCPPDSTLSYENFGKSLMEQYCTQCHSSDLHGGYARHAAPPDHNFDTLEGVRHDADHIDGSAAAGPTATNDSMPPRGYPMPTSNEREQLAEWIACGAP
jgi:uncharacterized membrane protein